ncbi:BadF/BadG/BcrA/BcrD ATPase family protein [Ignavibacteria bacterium]|nr:hypothetical protein [Bacteroidota bacterium]MCZ2133722.1 hypothetical protein [Bacteroidota bacterium]
MEKNFIIIGIDGGGSKTRGTLRCNGETMAETVSGTTRIGSVGFVESAERLVNIIVELCNKAKIDSLEVDSSVIGVAGVWLQEEKSRLQHLIITIARNRKITINDVIVTSDAEIALEGALEGKVGGLLIGGTGSITLGKISNGQIIRCGGWGIELDDEGSGAWIGREGLTAVVRSLDGRGEFTTLCNMIEERFPTITLSNPRSLVSAFTEKIIEYHSVTPLVMACAESGDKICKSIVEEAAEHLYHNILTLSRISKGKINSVACVGGMLEKETILSKILFHKLDESIAIKRLKPKGSALDGAISFGSNLLLENL